MAKSIIAHPAQESTSKEKTASCPVAASVPHAASFALSDRSRFLGASRSARARSYDGSVLGRTASYKPEVVSG
jgi:hypothetical protein